VTTDHREEPGSARSNCQYVLDGSDNWPKGTTAHEAAAVSVPPDSGATSAEAPDADGIRTERPATPTRKHAATMRGEVRREGRILTD
jgi:hypothetical protein